MSETSLSLLERLRLEGGAADWRRLVDMYRPWIHGWLVRHGVSPADADDLTQEVFSVLVQELPHFHHSQQRGAFRCWLRHITANRWRGFWRKRQPQTLDDGKAAKWLEEMEDPNSGLSQLWDQEHDRHVMARLLEIIEPEINATAWRAFRRQVLEGEKAATVADELGISVNVVLLAKSRILRRLRQEAPGFLD